MVTVSPSRVEEKKTDTVSLTINGRQVGATKGATVLEAALSAGIYIPTLCYDPDLKPYGACRLCVVEIEGMRGLVSSCTTPATEGMVVHTETPRVDNSRRITMELIIANHHGDCLTCAVNQECELLKIAQYLGMEEDHIDRLRKSAQVLPIDESHPAFIRDPNKCILCAKCVRACHEIASEATQQRWLPSAIDQLLSPFASLVENVWLGVLQERWCPNGRSHLPKRLKPFVPIAELAAPSI
jgi:NADH dehydrogenase/NADH:ubiquinone oxidoreductase subunit G